MLNKTSIIGMIAATIAFIAVPALMLLKLSRESFNTESEQENSGDQIIIFKIGFPAYLQKNNGVLDPVIFCAIKTY